MERILRANDILSQTKKPPSGGFFLFIYSPDGTGYYL